MTNKQITRTLYSSHKNILNKLIIIIIIIINIIIVLIIFGWLRGASG